MTSKVVRQSAVEKAKLKLSQLKEEGEDMEDHLNFLNEETDKLSREMYNLKKQLKEIQTNYSIAKYKAKYFRSDAIKKENQIADNKSKVKFTEMMIESLENENKLTNEKKRKNKIMKKVNKGIMSDPLLNRLNGMPEDIVKNIESFLPVDIVLGIKIQGLELKITTRKLLSRCSKRLRESFLQNFASNREFLAILPYCEAIKEISRFSEGDPNYEYAPYRYITYADEATYKITHLIEMAKVNNPVYAFKMLKKLHILIDPSKKHILNLEFRSREPLTIDDFDSVFQIQYPNYYEIEILP
jgi:hypothetical protein